VEIATPSGRVVLRNAKVVGIVSTHELERVSLTFHQIEWEYSASGKASQDDWSSYPP